MPLDPKRVDHVSMAVWKIDDALPFFRDVFGWKEAGRFKIPRVTSQPRQRYANNIWTHPVVANGRLYLRDQDLLFCFDVKGSAAAQE